ncbi:TPA: DUF550 domain-containing protein [Klebsiella pneumoniae]
MNSKLTRERLQEIAEDGFLKHGESKELARMALAAMDSEPVKRVNADQMHHVCLEANRHLDKYGAMAKEVNKLLGCIPAQPAPDYPEVLPCPVLLEPGMRFGKGVKTRLVLDAIQRRAEHYAELEAMTPEERAEYDAGIEAFKAMLPQPAPVVPDGYVMVPMRLTAENGAKGALSGEFSETKFVNCPECFGDEECETCDGSGKIEITVPVTWTTIKAIWVKGVEHFAVTAQEND